MQIRIHVDREVCIGSRMCASLAGPYFEIDDEGIAQPIRAVVEPEELVSLAEESCPTGAISITKEPGRAP